MKKRITEMTDREYLDHLRGLVFFQNATWREVKRRFGEEFRAKLSAVKHSRTLTRSAILNRQLEIAKGKAR